MSSIAAKARLPLRLLAGLSGIFLFAYLVHRAGPAKLLQSMTTLGWGVVLVIAWGAVAHLSKTWAWRLAPNLGEHTAEVLGSKIERL